MLLLALAASAAAGYFLVQPDLADGRDRVDSAWSPLRAPLAARYQGLGQLGQALVDGGAADREVTTELVTTLERWNRFALRGSTHTDAGAEATIADQLEGLARRARANIAASARLAANPAVKAALDAFDLAVIAPPLVKAYNDATRAYQDTRQGIAGSIVADVLGFEPRPLLQIGT